MDKGQDEPDTIGPEGVEKLCKDLGVDPEDVRTFFALSPHPLLPLVLMPLSVCLSLFFCSAHAWLFVSLLQDQISHVRSSLEREVILLLLLLLLLLFTWSVLKAHVQLRFFNPHFATEQSVVRHSCHFH